MSEVNGKVYLLCNKEFGQEGIKLICDVTVSTTGITCRDVNDSAGEKETYPLKDYMAFAVDETLKREGFASVHYPNSYVGVSELGVCKVLEALWDEDTYEHNGIESAIFYTLKDQEGKKHVIEHLQIIGKCDSPEVEPAVGFKKGDQVLIRESSTYYRDNDPKNPKDVVGIVDSVGQFATVRVQWGNRCTNTYRHADLKHIPTQGLKTSETKTETQKETKMSKVAKITAANTSALKAAAKMEAGTIAINRIMKVVTPKMPMMVRGYMDTPLGRVAVANMFNLAVQQYASQNDKAQLVAEAMMEGAMLEMIKSFNIEEMINGVLDGIDVTKFTSVE